MTKDELHTSRLRSRSFGGLFNMPSMFGGMGGGGMPDLGALFGGGGSAGGGSAGGGMSGLASMFGGGGLPGLGGLFGAGSAAPTASSGAGGACTDYHFVFARGTTESQANFGMVGTPVSAGLAAAFPSFSNYNVVYPAGFTQMSMGGSADAVKHLGEYFARCPKTKFIVAGYSQGAALVHDMTSGPYSANVCAVLLFGDPRSTTGMGAIMGNGQRYPMQAAGGVFNACNTADPVCGMPNALGTGVTHLGYVTGGVTKAATSFAIQHCKT